MSLPASGGATDQSILINCDIGERGAQHPLDRELMRYIHIANIACGGHAGDGASIAAFRQLAEDNGVGVSAHLSYPDRKGFGRVRMSISPEELLKSLSAQRNLMPDVRMVKFHGALYNESCRDAELAMMLANWLVAESVATVLAPDRSEMARACTTLGIAVLAEGFCERRYRYDPEADRLELVNRSKDYASILEIDQAVQQARSMVRDKRVRAVVEKSDGVLDYRWLPVRAQTICIHSDSPLSLELVKHLREIDRW
ncbi:MAG: LamB/YcsF family protein [Spirochaetaceae bacterium]|nr:MAG: LamB/YcsF family protein [Spirochaetaceae bacterium]